MRTVHFEGSVTFTLQASVLRVNCARGPVWEALCHIDVDRLAAQLAGQSRVGIKWLR